MARLRLRSGPTTPGAPGRRLIASAALSLWLAASAAWPADSAAQIYPDVVAVKVRASGADRFDFDVTVSSPYDTPKRYADGFRVLTRERAVLGERKLLHEHADEQPFTRDLAGVKVPRGVRAVVVQARDQRSGYGGKTVEVILPGR